MSVVSDPVVAKLTGASISSAKNDSQRETFGSPARAFLRGTVSRKASTTSDSDSASMKPHQETWRVIGGGVMLGTATSAYTHGIRFDSF